MLYALYLCVVQSTTSINMQKGIYLTKIWVFLQTANWHKGRLLLRFLGRKMGGTERWCWLRVIASLIKAEKLGVKK